MKVGIVAGEKSGDYLGAELVSALKQRYPHAEFVGLAGPLMQAEGVRTLAEMDKISIMGIMGALKGLRDILTIRRTIKQTMLTWRPDVFIGIDVPDFNLSLEIALREAGIPTVHYVSPTVWAWRGKRIHKIKRAASLMLTLFPFEETYYQKQSVRVKYVGHPLAEQVQSWTVSDALKQQLLRAADKKLISLLPGSRMSEVSRLAPLMLAGATELATRFTDIDFVIPAANPKIARYLIEDLGADSHGVRVIEGHSRDILYLSHLTVLASGTAALEAGLFAKPMVVMYKVAKIEEWYAARSMTVSHFSMPNHLTNPPAVPELIQSNATVESLVAEVTSLLTDQHRYQKMQRALSAIAPALNEHSGELACDAIEALIQDTPQAGNTVC
ncbi:lipid-A-disaccharide synthase [Arenicella chitinivorans]|uniref:Lipid-A-disaccharide synthase n=1 Tax=Arenicella chitinivorans TaxID=1329800 RepID=A0A918RJB0_9GAMM|nr:lipid-A-disaccharide synthase [Arenicella chitinivorans]GHA00981.1 lipid-A-disaccharide synthase [Arenicella chitinivorans]